MANTFTQLYFMSVFAVQNRQSLIKKSWKEDLFKYITGIIQNNGHKLIAINGPANHLHILIGYKPHQCIPDLLQDIKGSSSKWINKKGLSQPKFKWQEGYGAFSYAHSQISSVARYIESQEEHHKKFNFEEEYQLLLKRFGLEFDKRYILKDVR